MKRIKMPPPPAMQSRQFEALYHATDASLEPGARLAPAAERGVESRFAHTNYYDPSKVYLSGTPDGAADFGRNIYKVRPLGDVEDDPEVAAGHGWDQYMAPAAEVLERVDFLREEDL